VAPDLTSFPRPSLAVDVAVLTVVAGPAGHDALAVLVHGPHGERRLPGRFLRERQPVTAAVADALAEKAGLTDVRRAPELLAVFDAPDRDPRAWTVSLAHASSLPPRLATAGTCELVGVDRAGRLVSGERLLFDHDEIVAAAAAALRERYEHRPDPDGLLEEPATLAELRALHAAVLGEPLRKDTFNRRMVEHLEPARDVDGTPLLRSSGGRPAQVYVVPRSAGLPEPAARRLRLPRA